MSDFDLRDATTSAIRFREPGRVVYIGVLGLIVIVYFFLNLPVSKTLVTVDLCLSLFVLAILANVAYCAAYVVDVFAQLSGFREVWLRCHWALFIIGVLFAAIITRFFSLLMFWERTDPARQPTLPRPPWMGFLTSGQ